VKKGTKLLFCVLFSYLSIFTSCAQPTLEVPKDVVLKTAEDYAKYELHIISAAKWLEETDLDKKIDKRLEANAFVIKWVTSSPSINIQISEQLSIIYGDNVQLLSIYLASYARNFLENKGRASRFSATKAALISIMNVYTKGIKIEKNKEMEKLIKLTRKNQLNKYIEKKMK